MEQTTFSKYYSNIPVLYKIASYLKDRETSMLGENLNIRCIKANNVESLAKNMKVWNFISKQLNLYHSAAIIQNMPIFTFHLQKRYEQQQYFNKDFKTYVSGFDFCFDFEKITECHEEVMRLLEYLNVYHVPYTLKTSGSGVHVVIPSTYTDLVEPNPHVKHKTFQTIAFSLHRKFSFPHLDLSIYNLRRLWKCPFTLDYKTGNVALPITYKEFSNFDAEMILPDRVIEKKYYLQNNDENNGHFASLHESQEAFKHFVDEI